VVRLNPSSVLISLLVTALAAPAAWAATDPTCLPIEAGDAGTPIIRATINDRGPFAFVLDTAASGSTVDPVRASELDLPRDPQTAEAQGMGGGITVQFHRVRAMRAGPVALENAAVPALPAPDFDSHDVAGLAGIDLLAGKLTVWTPGTGCVRVAPSGARPGPRNWQQVSVQWIQPWKIMLPIQIGDAQGWALLDTGAQYTTLNPVFAERTGLHGDRLRRSGSIAGIDGRELALSEGEVRAVTIGPWRWDQRAVRVGPLPVFDRLQAAGSLLAILGMDWLGSEGFAVDYGTRAVWLRAQDRDQHSGASFQPANIRPRVRTD
jgi:hypothetical protein